MNQKLIYNNTVFSWRKRWKSIRYALQGIRVFLTNEHNARIHLLATVLVLTLGVFFKVSSSDWVALVLAMGFVWTAEIFNTAMERIMDYMSKEKQTAIQLIKDLAAAAVLVAVLTALLVGAFVFIPKIIDQW